MKLAYALWFAAAVIVGSCAGTVSGTFPAVAGWLGVALALATVGASILLQHRSSVEHRTRR